MTSLGKRTFIRVCEAVDRRLHWDKLPPSLGLLTLIGVRDALRTANLHDTYAQAPPPPPAPPPADYLTVRTVDGSYNDLSAPSMGMANTRFGRNVPLSAGRAEQEPRLFDPNPRTVSNELLLRTSFKPAKTLNILAAAWLQFQTRDWFSHGTDPNNMIEVPDPSGGDPMLVPSTPADRSTPANQHLTTFINTETHWWDASQIYGSTPGHQAAIRADGGKLRIDANGFIDVDPSKIGESGGADGWWVGMELMTTVFMREHNAIVDRLKSAYPGWSDDLIFQKARLINAALIAKIHTIEWTPAILGHPALQIGMRANWFGLAGERVKELFGRVSSSDILSGIPGSPTAHHAAPYAITEDFVTVYRMHPLIPDEYNFLSLTGKQPQHCEFDELHGVVNSRTLLAKVGVDNALYSLGVAHPGAVTLHNSPRFMQVFDRTDGVQIDLNAVDLLRSRERGVPRYNDFRRLLRLRPAATFDEISAGSGSTAEQLRDIYDNDIEKVDTIVGMFGEPLPKGFGFSDTAFRIFVLMATRRLKSDRFFTVDFTPRVYTPEGIAWIAENDMTSVLVRHYPSLEPLMRHQRNGFAPWPVGG